LITFDYLFAAVHKGPYQSIQPLEAELGPERVMYLVEGISRAERTHCGLPYLDLRGLRERWGDLEACLRQARVKAVVRSSSEDVLEENVEELAAEAASRAGVPVFVVEDFPGNYWPRPDGRQDGLFVEDASLVPLHAARGVDPKTIRPSGNPRYAALQRIANTRERRQTVRRALGLGDRPVVLWTGQPDGDNSYHALERMIKGYGGDEATLLFRAHPRDGAYAGGRYASLLKESRMPVVDTSSHPDLLSLYCAADLVMTQFSSAAVEASYLGVPALFVLFDDLGKRYLSLHKGYETPPWCSRGSAFLVEREDQVTDVVERALFDQASRTRVVDSFQRHFGARQDSAAAIAGHIRQVIEGLSPQ
jgi:hypothetical protein